MERRTDGKIKIGVCVMEKKVSCSPMEQILERLRAFGEFEIIIFGDKVILEDHIERPAFCFVKAFEVYIRSSSNKKSVDLDDSHKETKYCLDPKYATVVAPEQRVRTRLYFTSESHIHSLMNVLRYGNLDESLNREESLVCRSSLDQLFKTSELDYMSYIVLRMFENTEVPLEHPKRFRIEMKFSRGADISSLESGGKASLQSDDHTMQIMEPERLQEVGSYITLDKFDKMTRPFAMPAEDFPPAAPSQPLSVHFCKDIELQGGRLQHKSDMLSSMPRRKTKKLQE